MIEPVFRCPFGADLVEIETNMSWKVKKRVLGQYQIRRRFSTVDSCSTFYWDSENSEKRKELYIDSSNPSLNTTEDDLGLSNSREHLVQSINRICEPEKPLIVSIRKKFENNRKFCRQTASHRIFCPELIEPRNE